jgi:16S rRNA (guanine527-N7)-methyltransferase
MDAAFERSSLRASIAAAQRLGFLGPAPVERHLAHGVTFAELLTECIPCNAGTRIADLGSGGGIPGLVVAERCPTADVHLIERRATRADFLRRVASSLSGHVEVHSMDVFTWVAAGAASSCDVVTARGFGPPWLTAEAAIGCLTPGGVLIVSTGPTDEPWAPAEGFGLSRLAGRDGVVLWRWDGSPVERRSRHREPHPRWLSRSFRSDHV